MDFIDPPSGSVVANFEGSLNAATLTCNVSHEGSQRFTFWSIANFRGVAGRQSLGTLRDQNLPLHLVLEMDSFFNQVIASYQLDHRIRWSGHILWDRFSTFSSKRNTQTLVRRLSSAR